MASHRKELEIPQSVLHASLGDPVLRAMNFLNEAIDRYPDTISFAAGAPYPGFFDSLDVHASIDRYMKHLQSEKNLTLAQVRRQIFQYGPSGGQIRELVARYLKADWGVDAPKDSIVITVGCQEGLLLILRALRSSPNDLLVVVSPCYVGVVGAARLIEFELQSLEENEAGIDVEQLEKICRTARSEGKRVRALYVAPDFANPSGLLMDISTRYSLLSLADREDFFLIEDSTYRFTAPDELSLPSLKRLDECDRVILLGTFSKICLPGVRVGFVLADQIVSDGRRRSTLAEELAAIKSMITVNTSPICQAIIGGMLLEYNQSLKELALERAAIYRRNLAILLDFLDARFSQYHYVKWSRPSGGFFVRMRLPILLGEELVELSARDFGVIWTPMAHFSLHCTESHELRLSCSYLTPAEIDEGTRRLSEFVKFVVETRNPQATLLEP